MKNNQQTISFPERKRFAQKKRLTREFVWLTIFAANWFLSEDLRYSDDFRRKKGLQKLREILGGPDSPGKLQARMNDQMEGILDRMKCEIKELKPIDLLIYSHSVAGLTNDLSARLAGLSGAGAVSVIRHRLRERIQRSDSPSIDEYLALLPKKGCRFGEEMLYLHNLKYRKPWKQ